MPGKNRATGYTDFYKGTTKTPGSQYGMAEEETTDTEVPQTAKQRKLAIKRRLMRKKA